MIVQRTVKLELHTSINTLMPTLNAYAKGFNFAAQTGYPLPKLDANNIHKLTYYKVREYLPAQLACSSRCKAVEALKSLRDRQKKENWRAKRDNREAKIYKCPQSKRLGIRYDARSYNIWFDRNQVSLLTVDGRLKLDFTVPEYFKQYLSWKRCSADLVVRDNKAFLHVVFEKDIASPTCTGRIIGVDRGINNPAVLSTGHFYGGKRVQVVKRRYQRLRSILQSKGHSGKRHLSRVSKKENRFGRDVNHCLSKQIVSHLKSGDVLVFEDLTNIRDSKTRDKEKSKHKRKKVNSWSFWQLEFFLSYKAVWQGVGIESINPRWTSRECSKCGYISEENRVTQSLFRCEVCDYCCHADLNASRVIGQRFKEARYPESCCSQAISCVSRVDIKQPNAPYVVQASKLQG